RTLLKAINDKSITVELSATDDMFFTDKEGIKSFLAPGGYGGSIINDDGDIIASQAINLDAAKVIAEEIGESIGETITHEINEAYFGAKLDPGGDYNSGYSIAHKKASQRDRVK